jgi:type I protein arginine methyltransferase
MKIARETILQRNTSLLIRVDGTSAVTVMADGKEQLFPGYVLTILDVFAHPLSYSEGLKKLDAKGGGNWIELTSAIQRLWAFGALISGDKRPLTEAERKSFGAAPIHIRMLNDHARTVFFINALQQAVRPGDVVVDIGTGSGVLAIAAARAGAKKVYAIEAGRMAGIAEKIVQQTEVAEKIEIIRGWSANISLPEKADVLVSEIIGNDPLAENILPVFIDARARLLKPGARIIPHLMKVFILPVHIPASVTQNRRLQMIDIDQWKQWYNIDFSPLSEAGPGRSEYLILAKTKDAEQFKIKGEPVPVADLDLSIYAESSVHHSATVPVTGNFNAMLMYFELGTGDSKLTTHPGFAAGGNSWRNPVWYFPEAEQFEAGSSYTLNYQYDKATGSDLSIDKL